MANKPKSNTQDQNLFLTDKEETDIDQRVKFELAQVIFRMIKLGGIINIIASLFVVFALYNKTDTHILMSWCITIFIINLINIGFAFAYNYYKVPPSQIGRWNNAHHLILAALCLAWGSIGVIFSSSDPHLQLYTITFLQVALIAFSLGTITDFTSSIIGTVCVLVPYAGMRIFSSITSELSNGTDPALNLSFSISLAILGIFLLAASYVGYSLLKKFFKLSFINVILNEKLEHMNKFLEKRVEERTKKLEESLKLVRYQATHDLLTDLPNQRLLLEKLESFIKEANDHKSMFCVVSLSINELEKIYDGLGYVSSSLIIKKIAGRFDKDFEDKVSENLQSSISVFLSRKDVFLILLNPILNIVDLAKKLEMFFSIFDLPIQLEDKSLKLTASIGVSVYPTDGLDPKHLLMNADATMLHAKRDGGNSLKIYKYIINEGATRRLEIENYLHSAIKNGEFSLNYQPFVDLKTGKICGAEALIRWNSPVLGSVSPDDFIPLAEANGTILPLGEWVLRTACKQTKIWHDLGHDYLKIAINLSSKQLNENITQLILEILQENNLHPSKVELELTEREAFNEGVVPVLKKFKEMQLCLSVDDFGTGYSGLVNLKMFDIDKLKIDKCFVRDLLINNDSKAIISNTISLAKKINVEVLAEGVETKEQLDFLLEHGCDMVQGYYFSRPLNVDDFTKLIEKSSTLLKSQMLS